jgi:hypothetical protein
VVADNTHQLGGSWLVKLWALPPERKYPQEEGRRASLVWTIYPVVRRLDAELYAEYLRDRLPGPTVDLSEWRE